MAHNLERYQVNEKLTLVTKRREKKKEKKFERSIKIKWVNKSPDSG